VIEYHLPTVTVENQVTINGAVTIESGNVVDFRSNLARPIRNRMSVGREVVSMTMTQRLRRSAIETPELPSVIVVDFYYLRPDGVSFYRRPDGTSRYVRA
jgi:hypothetical protein